MGFRVVGLGLREAHFQSRMPDDEVRRQKRVETLASRFCVLPKP